jgi:hypothetical protein
MFCDPHWDISMNLRLTLTSIEKRFGLWQRFSSYGSHTFWFPPNVKKGLQIRKRRKKLAYGINEPKNRLNKKLIHLEGRKMSWGTWDISDNFRGRQPKKLENHWFMGLGWYDMIRKKHINILWSILRNLDNTK